MRIAISGSTSTGKTTLIKALAQQGVLRQFGLETLWTDERALLEAMGFKDMAQMKEEELCAFQKRFVQQKADYEAGRDNFITEHSYVDCAAYWVVRDQQLNPVSVSTDELTLRCQQLAGLYAVHILLPFGAVPFQADGYRSTDLKLHRRVADQIGEFLTSWQLPHVVLRESDVAGRVREVTDVFERIKRGGPAITSGPGSRKLTQPEQTP